MLVRWGFHTSTDFNHTGRCSGSVSFEPKCPARLESSLSLRKWAQDEALIILSNISEGLVGFLSVPFASQGMATGEFELRREVKTDAEGKEGREGGKASTLCERTACA